MPEPICYQTALEALGLCPEQVAFVGHDSAELAGASALGMPTIAFNHDGSARADAYVTRFAELLDLIPHESRPRLAA
jgi:FMN phosphatase YigB (HAD superfamily)